MKFLQWFLSFFRMGADTTGTTLTEAVPTIVAAALLELDEGDVVSPLVTQINFTGPGLVHQTPFIRRLTATNTDDLQSEAMDAGSSDETSPSAATVSAYGAYVQLKDLARLASVGDMAATAGQLIGQAIIVKRDSLLTALFSSFVTNQGGPTATGGWAPADLYDAYGSLREAMAPLPYELVVHPLQIWSSTGIISLFDNSSDAIGSAGFGTVGEDWAKYGFSGMALGFRLWVDKNVTRTTTVNGSGCAFSREAMKIAFKRQLMIEIERDAADVADRIVGSEFAGVAIQREKHGNEMQFPKSP